ncbi:MAG: hypothetical protein PHI35_06990 [Victivallaceae bacterium]|nr:hypothetical protein [Victivallaceae bacterium]
MVIRENQGKFYCDHELVEIENAYIQDGKPRARAASHESASVINVIQNALISSGFDKTDPKTANFLSRRQARSSSKSASRLDKKRRRNFGPYRPLEFEHSTLLPFAKNPACVIAFNRVYF